MHRRRFVAIGAAAALQGCRRTPGVAEPASPRRAALIVHGGTIHTGDPQGVVEAIAIADGRIVDRGDGRTVRASWQGPGTTLLDLEGGSACAGLCDAHAHLVGLGRALATVDLRGAGSIDEVVARLRAGAPASGWVHGRGWDQNLWPGQAMPTHHALTAAFPDRPVWLRRVDGHAGWGNAALLAVAGLGRDTTSPAGGEILRDGEGLPTGVLVDAAMALVTVPATTADERRTQLLAAQTHALQRGLTGVHEMGIDADDDALYRALDRDERLQLRVHAYASEGWLVGDLGARDANATVGRYALVGVKLYADGALGSRGAALLADYDDRPGHRGLMQHEPAELTALVERAVRGGWQPATHAIGDAANRATLDAYAAVMTKDQRRALRPRIEHAQVLAPSDLARFAELGVIASMQPTHATSDMAWVPARLGPERSQRAYAWRSLLLQHATLCFGSDFPVERVDPTLGLYAAITRQDLAGAPNGGWLPEQRLSLDEALWCFTQGAAFAVQREHELGTLAPGMRADVTCFTGRLDGEDRRALATLPVRATIIDGHVVWQA
ncbi:MAG: amidohydrolase [Deltaproteobacteria bacterium]|nr:amidohydrolase [Deltaproteobacteria bacterium]MBP7292140.1 amidohydrolase [Nannocystaceae bacterium]